MCRSAPCIVHTTSENRSYRDILAQIKQSIQLPWSRHKTQPWYSCYVGLCILPLWFTISTTNFVLQCASTLFEYCAYFYKSMKVRSDHRLHLAIRYLFHIYCTSVFSLYHTYSRLTIHMKSCCESEDMPQFQSVTICEHPCPPNTDEYWVTGFEKYEIW